MAQKIVSALRRALAELEPGCAPQPGELTLSGADALDDALGGGFRRGCLHEAFGSGGTRDAAAASGFGLGLALRFAGERPLLWVRQDFAERETGLLYGAGLADFGLDPGRLVSVRAASVEDSLRAAAEGARCPALGAVLVEVWGEARALDLTASRRLSLAAQRSGVPLVMIRPGAVPGPSAAMTRWLVAPAPSRPLEANAPGRPAFLITLLRHRAGIAGRNWHVEWDRDRLSFAEPAPVSRALVSRPADRAAVAPGAPLRRAG